MKRGDVILVRFPHLSELRGKRRPAVIVLSDKYSGVVSTFVVAEVTKNLNMASDAACLFIDTRTPEGRATGLVRDSVVSCLVLVTVYADIVTQILGAVSASLELRPNSSLRAALELP